MRMTLLSLAVAYGGCTIGEEFEPPTAPHIAARVTGLFGLNVQADGARADTVSDLGAQWVRIELVDDSTDVDLDPGVAGRFEAVLDDYHARGMRVLLIVDYSSYGGNAGFGTSGPCGDWEGWRAGWTERLGRVAERYGDRVDAWQIWNEPDQPILPCGSDGYNPGMPAGYFGVLLRDAYGAIRNAGATAPVITAGLDSGQVSYVHEASAAAGGLYADGVAIHPYGVVPDASWCPNPGEDLNCEWGTLGGKVDEYHAATGLPVWISEFGVRTGDTRHAADYLAAAYTAFESRAGIVAHAFFFCESDAMVPPFGLTFDDGSPKPDVYAMYRALTGGGGGGGGEDPPPPGLTSQLHGAVEAGGGGIEGIWVSVWGHEHGDFHVVATDALGIFAFTDLDPGSRYNVVVNGQFEPSAPGGYVPVDGDHALDVRNNVVLESGPDGWHGENFSLPF
jgi:hypothetical protein